MNGTVFLKVLVICLLLTSAVIGVIKKEQFTQKTINRWNQFHQLVFQRALQENIDMSTGLAAIFRAMCACGAQEILTNDAAMRIANDIITDWKQTEEPPDILNLIQRELQTKCSESLNIPPEVPASVMQHNLQMMKANAQLNSLTSSPYILASMILYAYIKQMQESNCLVRFLLQYDWGIQLLRWCRIV